MTYQIHINFKPGDAVYNDIGNNKKGPTVWGVEKIEVNDKNLTPRYFCRNTDTGEIVTTAGGFYSFEEMCEMRREAGYQFCTRIK